jgi:hypothetical protein
MTSVDSLMYPLAHRAISLVFRALCTSFLTTLKSVHGTWPSPRRGHHPLLAGQCTLPCRLRPATAPMHAHGSCAACQGHLPPRADRDHHCCSPAAAAGPLSAPWRSPRLHATEIATRAGPSATALAACCHSLAHELPRRA